MGRLYIDTKNQQVAKPLGLAPILTPGNRGGYIDIVAEYPWTLTPAWSYPRKQTPYIYLKEYYLTETYLNQLFLTYGTKATVGNIARLLFTPGPIQANTDRIYEGLYDLVNPTGFQYKLPYFSSNNLHTNNTWTAKSTYQTLINIQKKIIEAAAGGGAAILGEIAQQIPIPGLDWVGGVIKRYGQKATVAAFEIEKIQDRLKVGLTSSIVGDDEDPVLDKPHIWSTTTPRVHKIAFPLFNTPIPGSGLEGNSEDIIARNWEFCHLLSYQNLYNKRNLYTGLPPVYYEINIPGVHYCKAGYVSELKILNLGNIRVLNLPIEDSGTGTMNTSSRVSNVSRDCNVPDAYMVEMTIVDFFVPSKNFLDTVTNVNNRTNVSRSFDEGGYGGPTSSGPTLPGTSNTPRQTGGG
jgi:hypothetical protein